LHPISHDEFQQIVARAQQGDENAVGVIYDTYIDALYRYIRYRTPTTADAEDLTTEVFLSMIQRLPTYRPTGAPFEAWLYRMAAALIADFYRRAGRRIHVELSENLSDGTPSPEEHMQAEQEIETLQQACQELNDEQQTILFLRFHERRSHEEVAHILGKSVDAVRNAQHRALSRLATLLGSEEKARHYLRGQDG
jgi:RNA polymerase sigma-70 factor (ECF subfamily)